MGGFDENVIDDPSDQREFKGSDRLREKRLEIIAKHYTGAA